MVKRKYYLIDTENVGDCWYDLVKKLKKKDRIITFFTENHSNNLEKFVIEQVHNPQIQWLECAPGNNALDYQLIGVLSYLISRHPGAEFCIFSNDNDYQSTVEFWASRGIQISQKGYKEVSKKKNKKKKGKKKKKVTEMPKPASNTSPKKMTEEQYVTAIAKSVPVSDRSGWHAALTSILGRDTGRKWYLQIRSDYKLREKLAQYCSESKRARGINLISLVLGAHNLDMSRSEEAYEILQSHDQDDLSAIKNDFDQSFGKKPPQKYFKALRPLIRQIKKEK